MQFVFLWTISANNAAICCDFVFGDVCFRDEKTGVGAFDVSNSLKKAPKLIGKALLPDLPVSVRFDQMSILEDITGDIVNNRTDEVDGGICTSGGRVMRWTCTARCWARVRGGRERCSGGGMLSLMMARGAPGGLGTVKKLSGRVGTTE